MADERIVIGQARPALLKEQKVGLAFVMICGVGALVLGGFYLWRHLAVPFVISYNGPKVLVGSEKSAAEIEKEKLTDTDVDGISDYDEKTIYHTSPYLADSDSDGVSDYIEITTGQDPNCATGKVCSGGAAEAGAVQTNGASGTFLSNLTPPTAPATDTSVTDTGAPFTAADIAKLAGMTTDQIRTLLIQSGADPAQVNAASDADIQALYHQILTSLEPSSTSTDTASTTTAGP